MHAGVSAYNAGDVEQARDLLTRAVEQGSDSADVFLDRLNRVGASTSGADLRIDPLPARSIVKRRHRALPPRRKEWIAGALVALVVASAMLLGGLPIGAWLSGLQVSTPAPSAQAVYDEPLPVVRASEIDVARARALHADGRLLDALRELDSIGIADPYRAEADRLRAEVQRDLFTAAGIERPAPDTPGGRP